MSKIVLAVTGASAQPLAERALQLTLKKGLSVHLVLSKGAYQVWSSELGIKVPVESQLQVEFWKKRLNIKSNNLICHKWNDNDANIASGSFKTNGMIVIPCTMGTLGRIASGVSLDLIERCADVHLKEKRPLILVPRETPLNLIHLRNMTTVAEAGATISPPIPAWYTKPQNIDQIIDFMVIRIFDSLVDSIAPLNRWDGPVK